MLAEQTWTDAARHRTLDDDHVHLWLFELPPWFERWKSLLPELLPGEQKRALRFHYDRHRVRYVTARALSRRVLAGYCGRRVQDLRFRFGELGKPFLENPAPAGPFHFNTTDSGDYCLIAFTRIGELGVDIEMLPRKVNYEQLARKMFTVTEYHAIMAAPEQDRAFRFLSVWTRKEAWGKALGVGIRFPMDRIELGQDLDKPTLEFDGGDGKRYQLLQPSLPVSAVASLVAEAETFKLECYRFDPGRGLTA